MITDFEKSYRLSDNLFREAKVIIERSHAAEMIDDFFDQHRGAGDRTAPESPTPSLPSSSPPWGC